jgi:ATP diphosphatase
MSGADLQKKSEPQSNAAEPASPIERLLKVMARLRDPQDGCPWDIEQDFSTIAPYTIEEAYEVADAIERGDMSALREELGDLLLQVVYHARMAEELGLFSFADVAGAIADKMVRRHPHVFGEETLDSAQAQSHAWEEHKHDERARKAEAEGRPPSVLDGVALGLPALTRAEKLQKRAARVGFDWPAPEPVIEKIYEEIEEVRAELDQGGMAVRLEDEVGDLLFAVANLARHLGIDPESALRRSNAKFERRFRALEQGLEDSGKTPNESSLEDLEALWQEIKRQEQAIETE